MMSLNCEYKDYFWVSFRIIHDDLEPSQITKSIGIEPDNAHRKGDSNTSVTKKGKVMQFAPYPFGLWLIKSCLDEHNRLQDHLESLLDLVEPKKNILASLKNEGYELELSIGYNFMEESQPRVYLTNGVLKRIGDLGIDLCIDLYK